MRVHRGAVSPHVSACHASCRAPQRISRVCGAWSRALQAAARDAERASPCAHGRRVGRRGSVLYDAEVAR